MPFSKPLLLKTVDKENYKLYILKLFFLYRMEGNMKIQEIFEKFAQRKIKCIVIVDDTKENLDAARKASENFPKINWEFFDNGKDAINFINEKYLEIDLVITDRKMETIDAGIEVLGRAYKFLIPAVIVSGGFQHAGNQQLKIYPKIGDTPDSMLKDNPETWMKIFELIAKALHPERGKGNILFPAWMAHDFKKENPRKHIDIGDDIMKLARLFLER